MKSEKSRLILIKFLFEHGKQHASSNFSMDRMIAIHNFDNAIEWLLKSLALKLEISIFLSKEKRYLSFYELCKEIEDKIDKTLPFKDEILGLHDLRNKIQHYANVPSSEDIKRYNFFTEKFIKNVLEDYFKINYDELSFVSLIDNKQIREGFLKAEELAKRKKYKKCIAYCWKVFSFVTWEEPANVGFRGGELSAFFGAGEELINLIHKDYIEVTYPNNQLAMEIGRALNQLCLISTSLHFLTLPQKMEFLRIHDITTKKKVSKKDAQDTLNFMVDVILSWEQAEVIKVK